MRRLVSEAESATTERWAPGAVPTVTLGRPELTKSALLDDANDNDDDAKSPTDMLAHSDNGALWSAYSVAVRL